MKQADNVCDSKIRHARRQHSLLYLLGVSVLLFAGCHNDSKGPRNVGSADPTDDSTLLSTNQTESVSWEFELLDGRHFVPFENPETRAVVLVFIATDCPIANAYQPTIAEIHGVYADQGIEFLLVHPNREITKAEALSHASDFEIKIPVVLDKDLEIAKRAGAKVTPEAIVIQRRESKPVYRGAIDDQYVGFGKKKPAATRHYLIEAIECVMANRKVTVPEVEPVGCIISWNPPGNGTASVSLLSSKRLHFHAAHASVSKLHRRLRNESDRSNGDGFENQLDERQLDGPIHRNAADF